MYIEISTQIWTMKQLTINHKDNNEPFTKYQVWAFQFLQDIFVCAAYVPLHQLPNGGLPGFFKRFSHARHTYHTLPTIVRLAPTSVCTIGLD